MLENPFFQAIQSLVYDGTPEEVALNFLTHGKNSLLASHRAEGEKAKLKLDDAIHCL